MKRQLLLTSFALFSGLAATSSAALLLYEGFDYTVGDSLVAQSGGTGFSRDWADAPPAGSGMTITNGLTYGNLQVTGGATGDMSGSLARSMERGIANAATLATTGETQWFSYLLQVPTGVTSGQSYVTFFGSTTYQGFGTRVNPNAENQVLTPNRDADISGGNFNLTPDQTHLVVGSINWTSDSSANLTLWLDPNLDAPLVDAEDLGASTMSTSGALSNPGDWIWIRGNGNSQFLVDEIRLGTTLASVTPVPEPSTYAMIFGGLALGFVVVRRRRNKIA